MRPLEGVRVLELAEMAFVPACGMVLGEWGADVVKVEKLSGDPFRNLLNGIRVEEGQLNSSWEQFNRGKRSVSIDLQHERAHEALAPLVRWADVFVTSYRPQARRKLHIEPADLFSIQPRLVYAKGHGQGHSGPDAEAGGFDGVSYWHRAGVCYMLTPEGHRPLNQRGAMGDGPSGLTLAGGVAAALLGVQRTGRGVVVDVSLMGFGMWQLSSDLCQTSAYGDPPRLDPGNAPNPLIGQYETQDGRTVMLVMLEMDRYWAQTCRALGRDDWIDHPAYDTQAKKAAAAAEVRSAFQEIFASKPLAHWNERLRTEGCVFSATATPHEVLADPQVEANGYVLPLPERDMSVVSSPVQFDETPHSVARSAPRHAGAHTDEILGSLGLSPDLLRELRGAGVIGGAARSHDV